MNPATTRSSPTPPPATGSSAILVTGASGFVGRYVTRELLNSGYRPVCLVRSRQKLMKVLQSVQEAELTIVEGDILDSRVVGAAARGCSAAIHLVGIIEEKPSAAQTFERMHVAATRCVVEGCLEGGVTRYVHMSALGARPGAVSRYHQTKWAAEEIVRASGLRWTVFRPSVIHGPDSEFMQMIKHLATSRVRQPVMPYFGSGTHLLQPVSVKDVALCFVRALSLPETVGKVFEIGGPERFTWKQLYDVCAKAIAGRRRLKVPVPVPLAMLLARTVIRVAPAFLVPYRFNVDQVLMSQEDSVCETEAVEKTFGLRLRDFREELLSYAHRIE